MIINDTLEKVVDNRGKTPPTATDGHFLLEINCIAGARKHPDYSQVKKFVSEDTYNTWFRSGHPQKGDVLISTVGTLDAIAVMDRNDCCIAQNMIAFRTDPSICDSEYLYYYLCNPIVRKRLLNLDIGGVQPSIKVPHIKKLEIVIPKIDKQKKIASVLSAIDEKIQLNFQINDNLQQQAFGLFNRLFSSSQGPMYPLNQIAELNPKRQIIKGTVTRCIEMAQLSTSGAFPSGWEMKPYCGGMKFTNGDTIMARITPCLENGKTAFIDFLDDTEVAFGSTEYIVISTRGEYPAEYFYCLARYPSFVDYAVKNMNGSSGRQRVSAEILGKYLVPLWNEDEISYFNEAIPAMFRMMRNNSLENLRLASLRDALLPKLMSGEIDVSDIAI